MTEQELRQLVREAIARVQTSQRAPDTQRLLIDPRDRHASHALFVVPDGSEGEGACIIEPAAMCNHCGYCRSMGH